MWKYRRLTRQTYFGKVLTSIAAELGMSEREALPTTVNVYGRVITRHHIAGSDPVAVAAAIVRHATKPVEVRRG